MRGDIRLRKPKTNNAFEDSGIKTVSSGVAKKHRGSAEMVRNLCLYNETHDFVVQRSKPDSGFQIDV